MRVDIKMLSFLVADDYGCGLRIIDCGFIICLVKTHNSQTILFQ